ncbi:hypothetical protein ANCCAN_30268, partial [Ancylostoma caninum]
VSIECVIRHYKEVYRGSSEENNFSNKFLNALSMNMLIVIESQSYNEMKHDTLFQDLAIWDREARKHIELFMKMLLHSCKLTLQNKEFMQWLTDQKFDLAFSHSYHTCPVGLIHAAKIPTWIWLNRLVQ